MLKNLIVLSILATACGKSPERLFTKKADSKSKDGTAGDSATPEILDELGEGGSGGEGGAKPITPEKQKETTGKIIDGSAPCTSDPINGRQVLRLLTRDEFQNTVRDVLKAKVDYRAGLPVEIGKAGFKNNVDAGTLSDSHITSYLNTAIQIVEEVRPSFATLVGCAEENATCAKTMIDKLGPLLWRRPLSAVETKELQDLFTATAADSDKLAVVLTRMLTSSHFLYRSEIGDGKALTAYEMASALSYYFWGTVPDEALLAAAKSGAILEEKTLVEQAERLFADPKSKYLTDAFSDAWLAPKRVLSFTKNTTNFPSWTAEVQSLLAEESVNTLDYFFREKSSTFADLMTSDFSIGPQKLAAYYGSENVMEGGISKIVHGSTPRRGVLGLGAVLASLATATETHPFKRGHFVLEHLYCHVPDPTPEGAIFQPPPIDKSLSTRERFAMHSSSPACKSCHERIDGIGFGMEDFDGVGLFRTKDNGKTIDASGAVVKLEGKDTKFNGTADLGAKVAESDQAKRCYALQWFRMSRGYVERPADVCTARELGDQFATGKLTLKDLIIRNITSPSYRQREVK